MQVARHELMQTLASLQPRDDQLYVVCVPDFPYEAISPFDNLASFSQLHQLVLGWPQRTPIFRAMKQKFGIADISRALYERPDVFFVGDFRWCHAIYKKYIREHHGVDVCFVVSYVGGHTYDAIGQFAEYAESDSVVATEISGADSRDKTEALALTSSDSTQPPAFFRVAQRTDFSAARAHPEKSE
jgi:hypothetical protein